MLFSNAVGYTSLMDSSLSVLMGSDLVRAGSGLACFLVLCLFWRTWSMCPLAVAIECGGCCFKRFSVKPGIDT